MKLNRCGQCRQFCRTSGNPVDQCGAWDQPTRADRQACEFFAMKATARTVAKPGLSSSIN